MSLRRKLKPINTGDHKLLLNKNGCCILFSLTAAVAKSGNIIQAGREQTNYEGKFSSIILIFRRRGISANCQIRSGTEMLNLNCVVLEIGEGVTESNELPE